MSQGCCQPAHDAIRDEFGAQTTAPVVWRRDFGAAWEENDPTARAIALVPDVTMAIQNLRDLIASATVFDPIKSRRRFRIAASDYITTVLLAPLLSEITEETPHIEFEILLPHTKIRKSLEDGEIDLLLTPDQYISRTIPPTCSLKSGMLFWGAQKSSPQGSIVHGNL
jgi:hypothetical protein